MTVCLKVPKKYEKYFDHLETCPDFAEDEESKYTLFFSAGYAWLGQFPIVNVKSKKQAIEYLSEAELEQGYEELKRKGVV